ncbi:MAG: cytochrome c [Acidobacteriota bacterium]|nr:cytochrome c [Acidobacteriota bacterium]
MLQRLLLTALAAAFVAGVGYAGETQSKIIIPVNKVSPTSGQAMFKSYCAPCHGVDGKGNGPAANALKPAPTDLTELRKQNRGRFPDSHIVAVLEFGTEVPAHGSNLMPVWGPILGKMDQANSQQKQLRISNLSRYLESIQAQ